MGKAANIRKRRGFYVTRDGSHRTEPTTGNLGPRDHGPHGKTLEQTRHVQAAEVRRWLDGLKARREAAPQRPTRDATVPTP